FRRRPRVDGARQRAWPTGRFLSPSWRRRKGIPLMSRLASRRGPASDSGAYVPTRSEIDAQTAEIKQRKLEDLANLPDPAENDRQIAREKLRKQRRAEIEAVEAKIEARRRRSFESAADAQPMSREDIAN